MTTATNTANRETGLARSLPGRLSATGFNWIAALLSVWLTAGLYLDGWAHEHGRVDESFFTPWHGVLYSAVFVLFAFLLLQQALNMSKGRSWQRALPDGYLLSLAGAAVFVAGGGLDLIWHEMFGIEVNLEALLSPTHLLLATSGALMVTGPVRALWPRLLSGEPRRWRTFGPLVVSMTLLLALFGFFTQFVHPFHRPFASSSSSMVEQLGMASVLLQAGFLMGIVLLALKYGPLPFGSLIVIVGLSNAAMVVFHDQYQLVPAALAAGVCVEFLALWLKPSAVRRPQFFLFAFAAPVILYSLYYLALELSEGIAWTIHLWLGSVFLAGIVGVLVAFLVASPSADAAPAPAAWGADLPAGADSGGNR